MLIRLSVCAFLIVAGSAAAESNVRYASQGGAYQEAVRKAFLDPISKDHGFKIRDFSLVSGLSDIRAQVKAGAVEWDVVELFGGFCQQAANEGLLEPLDYKVITNTTGIPKDLVKEYWVGMMAYSTVIAYNKDIYKDTPPKTWADFFNVEKFPGTRAMMGSNAAPNLEIALMADGVSKDKIYPIDIDRAFKKLETFKHNVNVWWSTGAQSAQLAQSQEVDMLSIWGGRIDAAIKEGAPYAFSYQDAVMDGNCLIVPKGAPNKENAMRLINFMIDPQYQANLPKYIPYGPMNQDAFKTGKITPEEAAHLVTSEENLSKQLVLNREFWAAASQNIQERWDKFMQK